MTKKIWVNYRSKKVYKIVCTMKINIFILIGQYTASEILKTTTLNFYNYLSVFKI